MIGTLDSQVIEKFREFQDKTGKYLDLDIENVEFENKYLKDNIILLNKNKGISSFKIINKLKWLLNANKVGHAGTLDPLAEGLMVVMLNGATKFSDYLMKKDKEYYVEFELGLAYTKFNVDRAEDANWYKLELEDSTSMFAGINYKF